MTEPAVTPPRTDAAIEGIHHVTAIASDPQPNLDFYVRFLGLRLVKKTVNFDDPGTYHFYYGDETGNPGTLLTFFPWPGARRGRHGNGQVSATSFGVPSGSVEFWEQRARRYGYPATRVAEERFGEPVLRVEDGDGLAIELISSIPSAQTTRADSAEIPAEHEIQGIHSATLRIANPKRTTDLLTRVMGFRETGRHESSEGERIRLEAGQGGATRTVDLLVDPAAPRGLGGAGTVHHIAFRTPDDEHQLRWQQKLMQEGQEVTPVMDRTYFRSIYYREPGGVLFEIATDLPGFLVDESYDNLGTALKLPEQYEPLRSQIEAALPPVTIPTTGLVTESW